MSRDRELARFEPHIPAEHLPERRYPKNPMETPSKRVAAQSFHAAVIRKMNIEQQRGKPLTDRECVMLLRGQF